MPLRIAIEAQLYPGMQPGGALNATQHIIGALGQLDDGNEEYMIITHPQAPDYFDGVLGGNQTRIVGYKSASPSRVKQMLAPYLNPVRQRILSLLDVSRDNFSIPLSNGFYENLGCDLIHFPYPQFVISSVPSVYQLWDLQHLYYPQFFTPRTIARREAIYPMGARLSRVVITSTQTVRDSIVKNYSISEDKIAVIPPGPPVQNIVDDNANLPDTVKTPYIYFPANTWEHKNHLRLLEALKQVNESLETPIHLVCTGNQSAFYEKIHARIQALNLDDCVQFLGHVSDGEVVAIYRNALFVVYPSLFEGFGMPVIESWVMGKAVACSDIAVLREVAADNAQYFDPTSIDSMASAIKQLVQDPVLNQTLATAGMKQLDRYKWNETAYKMRAIYRYVAGITLDEADNEWLKKSHFMT